MAHDREDEERTGLDLPAIPLESEEEQEALERLEGQERVTGEEVDPGPELEPNAETGISRVDAPGQ